MKGHAALATVVSLAWSLVGVIASAEEPFICGSTNSGLEELAQYELLRSPENGAPTYEARFVFISYPDAADSTLPVWADSLRTPVEDFVATMSRGQRTMHATILKRSGADSTFAWVASKPSGQYSGWGEANTEIMSKIAAEIESTWVGVTTVFMMHDMRIDDPSIPANAVAYSALLLKADVPGFSGSGAFQWTGLSPGSAVARHLWIAMHEFGHRLGLTHSPRTEDDAPHPYVNMGRYDLMTQVPKNSLMDGGLVPYNPIALARIGWVPVVEITQDTMGVEISDVFDPSTSVSFFVPVDDRQGYFIVNHQAQNAYESRYRGSGLLVWHVALRVSVGVFDPTTWFWPPYAAIWDLELASGKFDPTTLDPDADGGRDSLEAYPNYLGSGANFFDGVTKTEFSCETNPNSNLYDDTEWTEITTTPQHVRSGVAVEDISVSPSGVMTFDVRIPPPFHPNGGEELTRGTPETIEWNVRCGDCSSVDILLSRDGGTTYCVLAEDQPNTGSFEWHVIEAGSEECRVKVVSHSSCTETWSDESDADFSIVDLRTCQ